MPDLHSIFPDLTMVERAIEAEPKLQGGHNVGGLYVACKAGWGKASAKGACVHTLRVKLSPEQRLGDVITGTDLIAKAGYRLGEITWRIDAEDWNGDHYHSGTPGYDLRQAAVNVIKHELVHIVLGKAHVSGGPVLREKMLSDVRDFYDDREVSWTTWKDLRRMRQWSGGFWGKTQLGWPPWDPKTKAIDASGHPWDCRCAKKCKNKWPTW